MKQTLGPITRETMPEMFAAMDKAAAQFWAYPSLDWQNKFIEDWLNLHHQVNPVGEQ